MKAIKNPLPEMVSKKEVEKLFGKTITEKLMSKPVYKYSHKSSLDMTGIKIYHR